MRCRPPERACGGNNASPRCSPAGANAMTPTRVLERACPGNTASPRCSAGGANAVVPMTNAHIVRCRPLCSPTFQQPQK
eukprot:scaffold11342_cov114-Isochrysis_galbana.AAC.12